MDSNDRARRGPLGVATRRRILQAMQSVAAISLVTALAVPGRLTEPAIAIALAIVCMTLVVGVRVGSKLEHELSDRSATAGAALRAQLQIEELFAMTDMLQSADGHDDAATVLETTARRLLPTFSGALYVFNNSRDRLDLARSWNESPGFAPAATLLPSNCWALKRGKHHINEPETGSLRCLHHVGAAATLEVPMMARGKVHGLLVLGTEGGETHAVLKETRRLGRAMADSMSLALANIALNEKLRTQSLRDPLTGLYNRRYMEDVLERTLSLAERQRGSTALLMIDLDNFKRLNDEHGHAKGDAVLRDVAAALVGGLRPTDVVSRYGGEELLVILPDCTLAGAMHKAEALRARIESLGENHDAAISASIGVAAIPECANGRGDALALADAALYRAKGEGKNRVRAAECQAGVAPLALLDAA